MRKIVILGLILGLSINSFGQKLSLTDLQNISNKTNWEYVNQYLMDKGWEYYESEKGSSTEYNTITWSFHKSYDDKAQAWFYLYTYEGLPNKINYSVFNKPSYTLIQKSLSTNGYKLSNSEIEDNELISTYANSQFILKISTEKREREYEESLTGYDFLLIKKSGVYDPDNGAKTVYFDNSFIIEIEYNLKNGKLNGPFKSYHENGQLKKIGSYLNGKGNGLFKEYFEDGSLKNEYSMKDDVNNGDYKTYYENGQLKKIGSYLNGKGNGLFKEYFEDGILEIEYSMKNGRLNGPFKLYYENGNIQKSGSYLNDKDNGLFKKYNEEGMLEIEYSMKDDVDNGAYITYYENGQIKQTGSYLNGKGNGFFKEYDENGELMVTYTRLNDEYNGTLLVYENGKVNKKINYLNGIREGLYTEFTYEDNGTLFLEYGGVLKNELKNGIWNLNLYRDGKKEIAEFTTYKNDIKEGNFKKIQGDSLIFGSYINDKLDGEYIVYIDAVRALVGGIIRTDSTDLSLQAKGKYSQGKRTGKWIFYFVGDKIREGRYWNDLKEGEWRYYYPYEVDEKGNSVNYAGTLYLTETYESGKLNGKSLQYSFINEEKTLCDTSLNQNVNPLDTCTKNDWVKCYESAFYKNDFLHGPYIYKDSNGNIILQGDYINNKKNGVWIEGYLNDATDGREDVVYQEGFYINDKREGKWIEYVTKNLILKEFYYSSGRLNGKYYLYNKDEMPWEVKTFEFDKLKTLSVYDSTGTNVLRKFEILKETDSYLKVRKTEYSTENTMSLEYFMKKDEPELNHHVFEIIFILKTKVYSNDDECYPDGLFILADNKNNVEMIGNLLKKDRIGIWKYNYAVQNVQIQIEYLNNEPGIEKYFVLNTTDLFNGTFEYNDIEAGIREKRKIKDGLRNGKTVYIDIARGKTTKKEKYEDGKIK
jgi:antitoxin component YwqK of YwqJK toxin-antitoxin module